MECNITEYTEQEIIIRPVAEIRKGKEDDYGFAKLEDKDIKGEGSTDWMPIAADYASTESGFWGLPEIGTMAVAVYRPESKQGIIIGFLYDEKHKPPVEEGKNAANRTILQTKKHRFEITDEDGTEEISLTTAKGKMKVVLDGDGGIKIINEMDGGKIKIEADEEIGIESEKKNVQLKEDKDGGLELKSGGELKISTDKDIMIKSSGELTLKSPKKKLSGSKGVTAKGKQVAKQDDKVVGVDTHIIMIPSINGEVPTPMPHPFTGQLKEKLEESVKLGYKKVAVKGSVAKHVTGHIPQGPRFQSQPKNKGEITGGTEPSVKVKGKEIAVLGSSVSTCSDVGERDNSKVIASGTSTAAVEKMLQKMEEEANAAAAATAAQAGQEPEEKKGDEKPKSSSCTQVEYGSTDLSQKAINYRKDNNIKGTRNVAVFEYEDKGRLSTLVGASQRNKGHAERLIAKELEIKGVQPQQIKRIYSELEPCSMPGGYCKRFLQTTYPNAEVTYSFEYGLTQESRTAGIKSLSEAVQKIF